MSAFTCRNSRRRAGPALVPVLGLALAVGLSGCGGGGNSGGSPVVPDPPQPVTTTLPTATFVGIQAGEGRFTDVTITVTGTLTATLDWTFSVNDLDIYVTNTSCDRDTLDRRVWKNDVFTKIAFGAARAVLVG